MGSNVVDSKKAYDAEVIRLKAYDAEIISEAQVTYRGEVNKWTTTLIRKYLRPYSLGPGPNQYGFGRSNNRYRRADVVAAWQTVPPAIRREREAFLQGYCSTDSVEEYIVHEAEQRALGEVWDAAEDAVGLSTRPFPRRLDWMNIVRTWFAAHELTPTQIAAVEKIPGWSWEIDVVYLKPQSIADQTSDAIVAETTSKPTTDRMPTAAEIQKFEEQCIEVEAYLKRKAAAKVAP
jgi:hypothetical protein